MQTIDFRTSKYKKSHMPVFEFYMTRDLNIVPPHELTEEPDAKILCDGEWSGTISELIDDLQNRLAA
jgi:hypothetical protein